MKILHKSVTLTTTPLTVLVLVLTILLGGVVYTLVGLVEEVKKTQTAIVDIFNAVVFPDDGGADGSI